MKTSTDAFVTFLITVTGLAATALAGPGVTKLADLNEAQLLIILLSSLGSTLKGVHSFKRDPNA